MGINKNDFIKSIKKGAGAAVGSVTMQPGVGRPLSQIDAAQQADSAKALLKNKLGMESVKARAASIGKHVMDAKAIATKYPKPNVSGVLNMAGKTSALGVGAVVGAGAYAGYRIQKAGNEARKAIDEQNEQSKKTFDSAKKLQSELAKRKAETGMSLRQRREKRAADNEKAKIEREKQEERDFNKMLDSYNKNQLKMKTNG